jgi:tRNA pseudouridine13 synthase
VKTSERFGSHIPQVHGFRQQNVQPPTQTPPTQTPPTQTSRRFVDHPTLNPEVVAAKMSAWQNLPAKLAADDKAAAAEWEARAPVNPDDVVQPIYKETFIETCAENEGRRTGYRATQIVADGKATDVAQADSKTTGSGATVGDVTNRSEAVNELAPASGPDTNTKDSKMDASFDSIADSHDGGVQLSADSALGPGTPPTVLAVTEDEKDGSVKVLVQKSPTAPGIETLETSLNNPDAAVSEHEQKPAKIAVIIKFVLGTSQYATMALRELMGTGGVQTFKPDFSMGR